MYPTPHSRSVSKNRQLAQWWHDLNMFFQQYECMPVCVLANVLFLLPHINMGDDDLFCNETRECSSSRSSQHSPSFTVTYIANTQVFLISTTTPWGYLVALNLPGGSRCFKTSSRSLFLGDWERTLAFLCKSKLGKGWICLWTEPVNQK